MPLLRPGATRPLAFLIFFSAFAVAQISAPNCSSTSYTWTFNSVGQSPCTVIAHMMGTCDGGQYAVSTLQPGYTYFGPRGPDDSDLCECSTVGYSLFSACAACQGEEWITWSEWAKNCTRTMPPGSFPNPVPSGIRVPQWALIDVTKENQWNPNESYSVGDNPELTPDAVLGPSTASVAPTSTSSMIPSTTPIAVHNSNTGAIVGGVLGGIGGILIVIAAVFFYRQRRPQAPSAVFDGVESPVPMKFYDPDDPPGYPSQSLDMMPSQESRSLQIGAGSNSGTMQTSPQDPRKYHGFYMPQSNHSSKPSQ